MKTITVISMTAAALLFVGCNSTSPATSSTSNSAVQSESCLPLTQLIAFAGTATMSATSAIVDGGSQGLLGLDVVSGVINGQNAASFSGSSSDGTIAFTAQNTNGLAPVNGSIQFSSAAWNRALSQLGGTDGQCLQSMTFDLDVSDQTLYGGQVILTVSGTQIVLAF